MSDHHKETGNLSTQEMKFNDCMRRAEDFLIIEQYSPAKKYYKEALDLHLNDPLVEEKIKAVTELQKFEKRTIIKILIVAVVIIGIYLLFRYI